MKKILLLILATILTLSVAGIAIASGITGAEYKTTIAVTNNSTATTNVAVPFTLSTPEMIDVDMLSANASDAAMISSGGSDTAFMPASDNSHPWITWVSSIGTDSQVLQFLYSKGASGGEIRYFPDDAGMSANDSASLKLTDNFTIEQSGWVDTTQVGANLTVKEDAFRTYISATANITSEISEDTASIGYTANDDDSSGIGGADWYAQTFTTVDEILFDRVRLRLYKVGTPGTLTVSIRETTAGKPSGDDLTSGTIDGNSLTANAAGEWYYIDLTDYTLSATTQYAIICCAAAEDVNWRQDGSAPTYAGGALNYSDDSGGSWTTYATSDFMFEVWAKTPVTATGISSANHTVQTTANVTHLAIYVDGGDPKAITALTANVTDNSENWTFCSGGSMPYVEYHKIWIGDTLQQHIEWEYNAVEFTDLSGNGHNVDPTFRTTSSDANISAEVSQQEGLVTGSTPSSNVSGGWTMITSALEEPENLFSEGGDAYAVGEFNVGELVTDYAAGAGHPPEPYHFLLAFGIALIVILGVYGFTHNSQMGQKGSLSLAFFAGGLVLIIFYRFETIPGWTLIPYGLGAILLIMWRRTPNPVD